MRLKKNEGVLEKIRRHIAAGEFRVSKHAIKRQDERHLSLQDAGNHNRDKVDKMKKVKRETFVYKGFGFPIKLINTPMKQILGEWVIDLDMNKLQLTVLRSLVYKPSALAGEELKFIRKYLNLTTTVFGKIFGVSHAAVLS